MSRIALDLDGTLLEKKWPELGDWMPDAIDVVKELLEAGHTCFIYSARLSPERPDGTERDMTEVYLETMAVQQLLDAAGLQAVSIWAGRGKPHWDILIDDKVIRFPGRTRSWRRILPKILERAKSEDTADYVTRMMRRRDGRGSDS